MPKTVRNPNRIDKSKRRQSPIEPVMEPARFKTIDLDVRSRRSLAPLVSAWPRSYQPQVGKKGVPDSRWLIMNAFFSDTAEAAAKYHLAQIAKLKGKRPRNTDDE